MFKFKKNLLVLFIALITWTLNAQSYLKSYYVSLTGDTIHGTALTDAYSKMSEEIRFTSKNGENLVVTPRIAKSIWLSPDIFFESKDIHFRNLSNAFDGVYFLRYLEKTDSIALMRLDASQFIGLYIQKKGQAIVPLQLLNDYVGQQKDDFRKKEIVSTDTIAYADQLNTLGAVGEYKKRKAYLLLLYQYFDYCDSKFMSSSYDLTENDMKKAFIHLAKCSGRQIELANYSKTKAWRPSVGITVSRQFGSRNFAYISPFALGIFVNYGDLRDGISVGMNWISVTPKPTAISSEKGAFAEYFLSYNRKLFLREKFNIGATFGIAYLKSYGLSAQTQYRGFSNYYTVFPDEQRFYGTVGISSAYQFSHNNYLTLHLIRNTYNVTKDATYFNRLQLQYEHRF